MRSAPSTRNGRRRRGAAARLGPYQLAWRRLRRNKVALAFGGLFVAIVIVCLLAPVYAHDVAHTGPNDEHVDTALNQFGLPIGPTWHAKFFLGADNTGRDVAVRLLYGGRNSLQIGAEATIITMLLATVLGIFAGYFRGPADGLISRAFELIWAYPVYLLGIALGVVLAISGLDLGFVHISGNSIQIPAIIIGLIYIPYVGKSIRGQVLGLREREFIDAARQQGLGHVRIMYGEILPNVASTIIVFIPLDHGQRDPHRGGTVVPRRRRAPAQPVVGDDDQRRDPPAPRRRPHDARAGDHAGALRARDQRVRRRRARRARPAGEDPDREIER